MHGPQRTAVADRLGGASGPGGRPVNLTDTRVRSSSNDGDRKDGGQAPRSALIVRKPFSDYLVDGSKILELRWQ